MSPHYTGHWREWVACSNEDPELFFPIAGRGTPAYAEQVTEAKFVCSFCPVREQCLEFALERIQTGVAGGLDEYERAALRKARGQEAHLPSERVLSTR
jgi:WhiB family redox-sensing transcriptional regulator